MLRRHKRSEYNLVHMVICIFIYIVREECIQRIIKCELSVNMVMSENWEKGTALDCIQMNNPGAVSDGFHNAHNHIIQFIVHKVIKKEI